MRTHPLGRTGLRVSAVGFGGSSLGSVFRPVSQADANAAVRAALDAGVNYFDTAPYYGGTTAETALGKALAGVPRERYVMATKIGRYADGFDFSAGRAARSIDESLRRLQCGHIDLIQVHDMEFGSLDQICTETIPALVRAREAGKVRFIGLTGLPLPTLQRVFTRAHAEIATVLSYCHGCLNDTAFLPWAGELHREKIGVLNAAPLAMGLLTAGGPPAWHPAPTTLRDACARAARHCRDRGRDLADLALSYSLNLPDIDCTIIGFGDASEVQRAVECAGKTPDPALLREVQEILTPVHNVTWPSGRSENN